MFSEYAVDPELLKDFSNLTFIRECFSPITGRLISDPFRDWRSESKANVYNAIRRSSYSPKKRKQIVRSLEKIIDSRSICKRPESIVDNRKELCWTKKILSNDSKYPFSAILSKKEHETFYDPSELVVREPVNWERHETNLLLVQREAIKIVDVMMPLLKLSSEITIIDPYFDISGPQTANVLREIIRRKKEFNFGQGVRCVSLYMRDERYNPDVLNADWIPKGFLKAKPIHKNRIHDRFLMTEHGCMQFGHGLAEAKKSIKVNVIRVSLEKAKQIRIDLDNPNLR
jgi:hypothetical protein